MKVIKVSVILLLSFFLSSSSCDKKVPEINDEEIKINEMTEPIKIDLHASDTSMLKSDQAFAFDFFEIGRAHV